MNVVHFPSFTVFGCGDEGPIDRYEKKKETKKPWYYPRIYVSKKKRKKESIGLVASTPPRAIAFKHRECFPIGLLFLFILIFLSFFFGKCSRLGVIKTPPFL